MSESRKGIEPFYWAQKTQSLEDWRNMYAVKKKIKFS